MPAIPRRIDRAAARVDPDGQSLFYQSLTREHDFEPLRVEGTWPEALRGSLVRNGAANFEVAGKRYSHVFEGDGGLCVLRLDGDTVSGAHRLIETEGLVAERRAGRPLWGSNASWLQRMRNITAMRPKNFANTNVLSWQGRLYALMEAAAPTEIDPQTLETLGESDFGGQLMGPFTAHPHQVASRSASYGYGVRYGLTTWLDLYELPHQGAARKLTSLAIDPVMLHDFVVTDSHIVFFVSPVRVAAWRILAGLHDLPSMFNWKPNEGTEVIVVPIDRPHDVTRFRIDAFYQWHFANGFDRADELVIDFARYDNFDSYTELVGGALHDNGRMTRAVLNPKRKRIHFEPLSDVDGEFPQIDTRFAGGEYRHLWYAREKIGESGLVHIDLKQGTEQRFDLRPRDHASEPIFVPRDARAKEGDGWLLALLYDGKREQSYFACFDAQRVADGPLAKAWFDHHVPMTFHGAWLPAA